MFTSLKKILSCSIFLPSLAYSATITGSGESKINLDQNIGLACSAAESIAIKNALDKFYGKEFSSTKKNYCYDTKNYAYCNFYTEQDFTVAGTVKNIFYRKEFIANGKCKVDIKAEVEPSRYIDVNVSGKNIYFTGEPLRFSVRANEELYLHVFNIHKKGINILFPYSYGDNNLIDSEFEFPGNGKQYVNYLHKGDKQDEEIILFLFTKHNVEFDKFTLNKNTLYEIINSIPNHSKRTFTFNILIKRK